MEHLAEYALEARVYRLESQVEIVRANTADNASDIRALRRETDAATDKLIKRVDQLEAQLYRLRMARLNTWILVIYFVTSVALYGALARGFGWI